MNNNNCRNCRQKCVVNESAISCDACQGLLHSSCIGLSDSDIIRTRSKSKAIKVVCNLCNANMAQFKDFKALINSIQTDFLASLNQLRADLENQVATLKESLINKPNNQFEEIVAEVMEREKRKNNLIIFGVPEQSSSLNNSQRADLDLSAVNSVLESIKPDPAVPEFKLQRLGRFLPHNSKTRPIKVTFGDESDVHKFIREAKKLKGNPSFGAISLSFDRTTKQIEAYKQLKQQLDARIATGEKDLKIRYVKGLPKIVSLN
ncbi:hypothetical protein Zmor_009499 [Zophobas morio]|uniref:Zinc finger PHD-type domain-containing protein n=1 Tax=Zophobas morio TaxID=2755281 RepID=A0AA38MIX8_9CUCU|nr:hypothetical protein Zmor_009499 [Zophobas morio]